QSARRLAQGFVRATIEEALAPELRGGLHLLRPHQCLEGACHLHGLSGEVLQKFLKERIWICQGQLHGYFSCRQQGNFLTSCSMPLSSMIDSLSCYPGANALDGGGGGWGGQRRPGT